MTTLDAWPFLQAALALAAVLALAWILGRAARRGGLAPMGANGRAGGRLSVQAALALDARRRLLLVRCDGREGLLLTGGPGGDSWLGWVEGPRGP